MSLTIELPVMVEQSLRKRAEGQGVSLENYISQLLTEINIEYCLAQEMLSHDPFSAEHIIPSSKGGKDEFDNLAWSCLGCNYHKFTAITAIDLVSEETVNLFHPRKDIGAEHFKWNEDYTQLIGLSAAGRATIN